MESSSQSRKGIVITIVAVVVVGIIGIISFRGDSDSDTLATSAVPADVPAGTSLSSSYKDGTYTAVGTYNSPGGPDGLKVTLVIKNNIVVDAAVVSGANDPESTKYQAKFISGFRPLVVGQKLAGLRLDSVAGSSLTGEGFNAAVVKIQAQAQA